MNKYTVYKITNLINEKTYIGVHKTNNLEDNYMGSGKLIKLAIEKYGIDNFSKEYLAIFDNPEEMFQMEFELVNEDFISTSTTYNMKVGGVGGFDHISDEERHQNRVKGGNSCKILKLGFHSDETKQNAAIARLKKYPNGTFTGMKHSDDTKRKIGEANSIHQLGEGNSQFGKMWIHNLELKLSKKIKKDELPDYIDLGWLKGRKMKWT